MQRHMHARAFAPGCAIVVLAVAGFARAETPDLIEVTENNVLRWDIDAPGTDFVRDVGSGATCSAT
jgi:hypothetical protein